MCCAEVFVPLHRTKQRRSRNKLGPLCKIYRSKTTSCKKHHQINIHTPYLSIVLCHRLNWGSWMHGQHFHRRKIHTELQRPSFSVPYPWRSAVDGQMDNLKHAHPCVFTWGHMLDFVSTFTSVCARICDNWYDCMCRYAGVRVCRCTCVCECADVQVYLRVPVCPCVSVCVSVCLYAFVHAMCACIIACMCAPECACVSW